MFLPIKMNTLNNVKITYVVESLLMVSAWKQLAALELAAHLKTSKKTH
jgi:hypothetical protein